MTKCLFSAALILTLVGVSSGQAPVHMSDYISEYLRVRRVMLHVLEKVHVSGSLEYWGPCEAHRQLPEFPKVETLPENWEGPPLQAFRKMFAGNPKMQVTQEPDGTIRMVENDVPRDLLDVKITHISFDHVHNANDANNAYDAASAQGVILGTPEVQSFMKANDIGWPPSDNMLLAAVVVPTPNMPHISGDLDNVTLSQALDYVLKTFPGFWVYENCPSQTRKREVVFEFFSYWPGLMSAPSAKTQNRP
jgi:hypothetical protein